MSEPAVKERLGRNTTRRGGRLNASIKKTPVTDQTVWCCDHPLRKSMGLARFCGTVHLAHHRRGYWPAQGSATGSVAKPQTPLGSCTPKSHIRSSAYCMGRAGSRWVL